MPEMMVMITMMRTAKAEENSIAVMRMMMLMIWQQWLCVTGTLGLVSNLHLHEPESHQLSLITMLDCQI